MDRIDFKGVTAEDFGITPKHKKKVAPKAKKANDSHYKDIFVSALQELMEERKNFSLEHQKRKQEIELKEKQESLLVSNPQNSKQRLLNTALKASFNR
ncbi:MAG: hypothetical protein AAFU57_18400 [Bacteroidota bacterium]